MHLAFLKKTPVLLALMLAPGCALQGFAGLSKSDGKQYLYGGTDPSQHFDITAFRLDPKRLNFGLGREMFPALIEPEFVTPEQAKLHDRTRILGVHINGESRVYPIELLMRHEVVNDRVGGRPIFAAYCVLADLAGVYDREMAGHVYTFAVSGYTYADPAIWGGLNAFVLWDRDTESLWLPTIGKAVSGPMIDLPMKLAPRDVWAQTTWGEWKKKHPDSLVLKPGQEFERPKNWPRFEGPYPKIEEARSESSIGPRGTE
jgi:hypothetical protein